MDDDTELQEFRAQCRDLVIKLEALKAVLLDVEDDEKARTLDARVSRTPRTSRGAA
jgi:hypothetical protein